MLCVCLLKMAISGSAGCQIKPRVLHQFSLVTYCFNGGTSFLRFDSLSVLSFWGAFFVRNPRVWRSRFCLVKTLRKSRVLNVLVCFRSMSFVEHFCGTVFRICWVVAISGASSEHLSCFGFGKNRLFNLLCGVWHSANASTRTEHNTQTKIVMFWLSDK